MMSPDFGSPIKFLFGVILVLIFMFVLSVVFGVCNYDDDRIESHKKIKPKMVITIENNKADTTYIYEK